MIGIGETALSAVVVLGTLVLTIGVIGLAVVRDDQIRVHALALGAIGPLIVLLSVPFWGDGRMVLTAILFAGFLLVASAVSAHAIMALLKEQHDRAEGQDPPGQPPLVAKPDQGLRSTAEASPRLDGPGATR